MSGQGQDVKETPELDTPWLSVAEASKKLGKTERTIRRYASGEVSLPAGVETRLEDGRIQVRISSPTQRTAADGRGHKSVQKELESLRLKVDMSSGEVVRLRTVLAGKEELLEAKEQVIQTLQQRAESDSKTIHAMEALVGQLQLQAPQKGETTKDTSGDIEASPASTESRLWLWLIVVLVLVVIAGGVTLFLRV